jgi:hypothetical protein
MPGALIEDVNWKGIGYHFQKASFYGLFNKLDSREFMKTITGFALNPIALK